MGATRGHAEDVRFDPHREREERSRQGVEPCPAHGPLDGEAGEEERQGIGARGGAELGEHEHRAHEGSGRQGDATRRLARAGGNDGEQPPPREDGERPREDRGVRLGEQRDHPGPDRRVEHVVARRDGAVLVGTDDGVDVER